MMSKDSELVVGSEAPRLIEFLIERIPEVTSIRFFRPPAIRPIQQDPSISDQSHALIEHALTIRESTKLPFWDSLLLHLSNHPMQVDDVLERATLHNRQDLDSFYLRRNECTEARIVEIIKELSQGQILAFSSKVLIPSGEHRHLPMLDFHCHACSENDRLVRSVVTKIGISGYVARSGRSYHFYGRSLIDEQSLITMLGRALLFCPIIDRAWIAHQLIERACGLRVSPGKEYTRSPKVIYEV